MHPYATERPPRLLFFLTLVAWGLSGGAAWFIATLNEHYGLAIGPISALAIFGALHWLFDAHLWRLSFVRRFLLVPDLNGTWRCDGRTRFQRGAEVDRPWDAEIRIKQSWSRIVVAQSRGQSGSRSIAASLRHEPGDGFRLVYHYVNDPNVGEPELARHSGVCNLLFDDKARTAAGDYYTDWHRMTSGSMQLQRKGTNDGQA